MLRLNCCLIPLFVVFCVGCTGKGVASAADPVRDLQIAAIRDNVSPAAHWGPAPGNYTAWGTHSLRLIPVYTYGTRGKGRGIDFEGYTGKNSVYRREADVRQIYGRLPTNTVNSAAEYLDQTELATLQRAALAAGKKHIFVVIFDGMDWQTTWAAAIYNQHRVGYTSGRGTGTHFQEYTASGTSQYGFMVTAPDNEGTDVDVNTQKVLNPGGRLPGGYNATKGGPTPWTPGEDLFYLINRVSLTSKDYGEHAYPDSAATATAICSGVKSYNDTINVDRTGGQVSTVAHEAQQLGYAVGAVTSVPLSHATPACSYAHNVHRDDYQDISRDMLGLKSISHPQDPLPGLDVAIGGGFGVIKKVDKAQGLNYVPGNMYLAEEDLRTVDVRNGGKYVVAVRTAGVSGKERLREQSLEAAKSGRRLLAFYGFGAANGHLPFATADGDYQPTIGRNKSAEKYSSGDLLENPTLADMTSAALTVLSRNPKGFWLMVEAGDVDWANHDNNLDNSIGAVNSGDAAVKLITEWVEKHSNWEESVMILTADHGHYLFLDKPELLANPPAHSEK